MSLGSSNELSVFLSYAHADKNIARALARELHLAGVRVWIDQGELRTGDSILSKITDALSDSDFVIVLISRNSIRSNWCKKELALAISEGIGRGKIRVLPLRLDNVPMPSSLRDVFYLQISSRKPFSNEIVAQLISDVYGHQHDLQDAIRHKYGIRPLSSVSRINKAQLKKLGTTLNNRSLLDDDPNFWLNTDKLDKARDALVNDYSIPAVEILFAATLRDLSRKLMMGWASTGLIMLMPANSAWIRRVLEHDDPIVVSEFLGELNSRREFVSHRTLMISFEAMREMGNWSRLKEHMMASLKKTNNTLSSEQQFIFEHVDGK